MITEFNATGQAPLPPREIIRVDMLERMGRELIALCDSMERHGLVDYQMGVWEEEILGGELRTVPFIFYTCLGTIDSQTMCVVIQECLDLLEGNGSGVPPEGSASASAAPRHPDRPAGNLPSR